MEARGTLSRARLSTGIFTMFAIALLAAFLLGGAGGYVLRVVSFTAPAAVTTVHQTRTHPVAPAPPYQTVDPKGYTIPI